MKWSRPITCHKKTGKYRLQDENYANYLLTKMTQVLYKGSDKFARFL